MNRDETKGIGGYVVYGIFCSTFAIILSAQVREWFVSSGLNWLYILMFSLLLTYILTPLASGLAQAANILDRPDSRKVHRKPTPLLGGAAIYVGFAGALFYNFEFSQDLKGIGLGATIILLVGLADDIREVSAALKFLLQIAAVTVMIIYGVTLSFMPETLWGNILEIVLTYIWMLGMINAVNFLDGLDGLASGLGAISALYIGLVAISTHQTYLMYISVAMLGSCLGFLPHNFRLKRPASIFLGDAGSTFIGFSLAALAIMGGWGEEEPIKAYLMPTLILGIFIYDMLYINISRIAARKVKGIREVLAYVGQDHIHHRLMALGLSSRQATLFIYMVSALLGLGAVAMTRLDTTYSLLLLIQGALVFMIIAILMLKGASLINESNH